ncbi:MAG: alpha-glycosidase [Lachnospiraceae bacterium]|nr:alpha-glycosidase [Lachnospiraceae bacterium]
MEKWLESVYSDGTRYFVSNPYPSVGDTIEFKIRFYKDSPVRAVFLRTKEFGTEHLYPMQEGEVESELVYYTCKAEIKQEMFCYHFYIVTDEEIYYYNQYEITSEKPEEMYDFKILCGIKYPHWVKESVFYQIFPERFCNGDPSLDVKDNEYTFDNHSTINIKDWNSEPLSYKQGHCLDFYGGDLIGIKEKIPYLKKLGITAVYINPVFYAATIHKYDCVDYTMVDPHFGGDKALSELCQELHKNDIKIMLDISINHTGIAHKWFNKDNTFFDQSVGAYNNSESEEREYYTFHEDNKFDCWYNVRTLPQLNYDSEKLRNKIYRDSDSILKKWLKAPYNIDGWRFDVAEVMARKADNRYHHDLWREIYDEIKSVNDNMFVLGEGWEDCSEFLNNNEWDSVMNYYGFTRPVRQFVGENDLMGMHHKLLQEVNKRHTAKQLSTKIRRYMAKLPTAVIQNQFNLIDSHDTPRLHNDKDISWDDYRAAVIMQFTMPGTPSIYYGDELEINGRITDMEGCRYPMEWYKEADCDNNKYYQLYQKLTDLKKKIEAFQFGSFKVLYDDYYIFAFARFTHDELWITIASMDDEERNIEIPLAIFGKNHYSCKEDIFGTPIDYYVDNCVIHLKVSPHKTYLLGV